MVVLFIHSSHLIFDGFFVQFCSTNNQIRGILQLRWTVFIGVVMRTEESHKMMLKYYTEIKGVQGASGCPKTKIVKRRFEDQEGRCNSAKGRGRHWGRGRRRRSAGPGAAAADPPAGAAVAAPRSVGRISPPAQPGDGLVRA